MVNVPEGPAFLDAWHAMDKTDRIYVRRVVRTGQRFKDDERDLARLGVAYARYQLSRPWQRLFWLWFLPGLVVTFVAGMSIHEVAAGAVLGAALLAWSARRSLKRAPAVNSMFLL